MKFFHIIGIAIGLATFFIGLMMTADGDILFGIFLMIIGLIVAYRQSDKLEEL